jgi:hypothetical protein
LRLALLAGFINKHNQWQSLETAGMKTDLLYAQADATLSHVKLDITVGRKIL